jgi:transposase
MIPMPPSSSIKTDVRVWLAVGRTDMRRGMNGLALQVQEALQRDPHAGDLFVFRGARGDLIKILWHDGLGLSLYAKRLERGRFVWPPEVAASAPAARAPEERALTISSAQLAYLLSGIDWRNPVQTFRPQRAG